MKKAKQKRTYKEAYPLVRANAMQLKRKKGKFYEKWKTGMKLWFERQP